MVMGQSPSPNFRTVERGKPLRHSTFSPQPQISNTKRRGCPNPQSNKSRRCDAGLRKRGGRQRLSSRRRDVVSAIDDAVIWSRELAVVDVSLSGDGAVVGDDADLPTPLRVATGLLV
ncbi:hypothetical protein E2542_SST28740 [Spatholobus suberectus]|nr:hypothetical protein E2542_SST28740 [Spatholobus suberectus]